MKTIGPPPEIITLAELGFTGVKKFAMCAVFIESAFHFDMTRYGEYQICWMKNGKRWDRRVFGQESSKKDWTDWLRLRAFRPRLSNGGLNTDASPAASRRR